jgi:geranylgeranyl diphosphate synthase type I
MIAIDNTNPSKNNLIPEKVYADFSNAINEQIESILLDKTGNLYDMMKYQLGWIDPHGNLISPRKNPFLLGPLCMMTGTSIDANVIQTALIAASLELIYNFTKVHEDVQEGIPRSDDRDSVWWVWGPGQAINVGDGLYALGKSSLLQLADTKLPLHRLLRVLELFDESCMEMCEGYYLDLTYQERIDVSISSYIRMASSKTGSLFACSVGAAALTHFEDSITLKSFEEFGRKIGIAYQIRKDLAVLVNENSKSDQNDRLLNKKKLYPIVHALEQGDLPTKRELGNIFFKRVLDKGDVPRILGILERENSLELAQNAASEYEQQAMDHLSDVGMQRGQLDFIETMSKYIIQTSIQG